MGSAIARGRPRVLTGHLSAEILRTREEFENLRRDWELLFDRTSGCYVYQSFLFNFIWWKHFAKTEELAIITVREANTLVGLAPLMTRNRLGVPQIEPIASDQYAFFGLLIPDGRDDIAQAIGRKLVEAFPKGLLHIPYYGAGDRTVELVLADLTANGWHKRCWVRNVCHYIWETGGFDSYFSKKSQKARYNFNREQRILDKSGFNVYSHYACSPSDVGVVDRIARLQRKSWLARRGQESLDSPFYRELIPAIGEVFFLSSNHEDIGFILNLRSPGCTHCAYIGFDEKFSALSPGKVLMGHCIQRLLDRGEKVYDFGFGEGEYKRFWANRTKYVLRGVCYRGLRGWILSWIPHRLHGVLSKSAVLRSLLNRARKTRREFRRWRS